MGLAETLALPFKTFALPLKVRALSAVANVGSRA